MLELTPEDETVEQAMELVVPGDDGQPKKFGAMKDDERERALARMREESGAGATPPERVTANAFRDQVREAAGTLLAAEQVQARVVGGHPSVELKGIPVGKVAEVMEAFVRGLK